VTLSKHQCAPRFGQISLKIGDRRDGAGAARSIL